MYSWTFMNGVAGWPIIVSLLICAIIWNPTQLVRSVKTEDLTEGPNGELCIAKDDVIMITDRNGQDCFCTSCGPGERLIGHCECDETFDHPQRFDCQPLEEGELLNAEHHLCRHGFPCKKCPHPLTEVSKCRRDGTQNGTGDTVCEPKLRCNSGFQPTQEVAKDGSFIYKCEPCREGSEQAKDNTTDLCKPPNDTEGSEEPPDEENRIATQNATTTDDTQEEIDHTTTSAPTDETPTNTSKETPSEDPKYPCADNNACMKYLGASIGVNCVTVLVIVVFAVLLCKSQGLREELFKCFRRGTSTSTNESQGELPEETHPLTDIHVIPDASKNNNNDGMEKAQKPTKGNRSTANKKGKGTIKGTRQRGGKGKH